MKAYLGALKTYLKKEHRRHFKNLVTLLFGLQAILPNNEIIRASEQGNLNIHPKINPKALVYSKLNNESLLSIGHLYDEGCIAAFSKNT